MENDLIILKHFIQEDNIQAAIEKEKKQLKILNH